MYDLTFDIEFIHIVRNKKEVRYLIKVLNYLLDPFGKIRF